MGPTLSKQMAHTVSRFTSLSGCLNHVKAFWPPVTPLPGAFLFLPRCFWLVARHHGRLAARGMGAIFLGAGSALG